MSSSSPSTTTTKQDDSSTNTSPTLHLTSLNPQLASHHLVNLFCSILARHQFRIVLHDCNSNSDISNAKDYLEMTMKHEKSSMNFRLKVVMVTRQKMMITAHAEEDEDRVYNWTFNVGEYLSGEPNQWKDYFQNHQWGKLYKNRDKFEKEFRDHIIKQLIPMSREDLMEDKGIGTEQPPQQQQGEERSRARQPQRDPRGIRDPDYDPLRVGPPRRPQVYPQGGVGSNDLYPAGFGPRPFGPQPTGPDGGMMVGPHSGMFAPRGGQPPINPPGVPPGARYDPFGQEPDRDDFAPPGPAPRREPRPRGPGSGGSNSGGGFNPFPF